jgi:hypothetical protein
VVVESYQDPKLKVLYCRRKNSTRYNKLKQEFHANRRKEMLYTQRTTAHHEAKAKAKAKASQAN